MDGLHVWTSRTRGLRTSGTYTNPYMLSMNCLSLGFPWLELSSLVYLFLVSIKPTPYPQSTHLVV